MVILEKKVPHHLDLASRNEFPDLNPPTNDQVTKSSISKTINPTREANWKTSKMATEKKELSYKQTIDPSQNSTKSETGVETLTLKYEQENKILNFDFVT